MQKEKIKQYLYHGITNLTDLVSILDSGYIMTRQSLREYLKEDSFQEFEKIHKSNWNGQNALSLACHPDNIELIERYNITLPKYEDDNAYLEYILPRITLILDPIILTKFNIKEKSLKMGYEIQILNDISINYIKAIGIRTNNFANTFSPKKLYHLQSVLSELKNNIKGKNFSKYYDTTFNLREAFENYTLEQIYAKCIYTNYIPKILELLKMYNLNIPVVDLEYGYTLPTQETQKKRIRILKKQYNDYLNSKSKK